MTDIDKYAHDYALVCLKLKFESDMRIPHPSSGKAEFIKIYDQAFREYLEWAESHNQEMDQ